MAKIALCTCNVVLSGDVRAVVHRGETRPVTWPEIEVLQALHGEHSVLDIEVIGTVERDARTEYERLVLRYGEDVCQELFPGKVRPAMEFDAPKSIPRAASAKPRKAAPPAKTPEPETGGGEPALN